MKTKQLLLVATLAVVPLIIMSGCNMGQYEEPRYTATAPDENNIELRDYAPKIVAQVEVSGEREEAISQGFRMIADYIFGNNLPKEKIAMTAPVIQQAAPAGEKISMTAPVLQQQSGATNKWVVQFVMPSEYTLATLPKPVNSAVQLRELPAKHMVAIRFSGSTRAANIAEHQALLDAYVNAQHLKTTGAPVLAFYDPPWTLPFFRRNEIMLELVK